MSVSRIPELLEGPKRPLTPLYLIGLFCVLCEVFFIGVLTQVSGQTRDWTVAAVLLLPFFVIGGFYLILAFRPMHLQSHTDFANQPSFGEVAAALNPRGTITGTMAQIHEVSGVTTALAGTVETPQGQDELEIARLPGEESREATDWAQILFADVKPSEIDFDKAEEAFSRVQQSKTEFADQIEEEIRYRYLRLKKGDTAALEKLIALAEQAKAIPAVAADAHLFLGVAYLDAGGAKKAEPLFRLAQDLAINPKDRAAAIGLTAASLRRQDRKDEALNLMKQGIAETMDDAALAWLYGQLAAIFEADEDPLQRALALEKALEHEPTNIEGRVDAALAYSSIELHSVAMNHNHKVLELAPGHSWAMNNLGVELQTLDMPALAIDRYKAAYNLENTLAAANLAYRYLASGFVDEATDILTKALALPEPHVNVSTALAKASRQRETEETTRDAAQRAAVQQASFLSRFADARFSLTEGAQPFQGQWRFGTGVEVNINQRSDQVEATWSERERDYKLKAKAVGRTAEIDSIRSESSTRYPMFEETADSGFMYISDDGASLKIMALDDQKVSFFDLTVSQDPTAQLTTNSLPTK
jgi:tetratricopeptide (TPR) repeat protein